MSEAGIAIISRKSVCEGGEVVNGKTKEGSEVLALFSFDLGDCHTDCLLTLTHLTLLLCIFLCMC